MGFGIGSSECDLTMILLIRSVLYVCHGAGASQDRRLWSRPGQVQDIPVHPTDGCRYHLIHGEWIGSHIVKYVTRMTQIVFRAAWAGGGHGTHDVGMVGLQVASLGTVCVDAAAAWVRTAMRV